MGWEARGTNGRRYLYVGRRIDGKVKKLYIGPGWAGFVGEAQLEEGRARRAADIAALREEQRRWAGPERAMDALEALSRRLVTADLAARGYYRHGGELRRRRHGWP